MKIRNFLLLTLLVTMFLGCAGREPTPGVTDTEILIGNIQDLSGPMKELGMALPHGSNLYFNYIFEVLLNLFQKCSDFLNFKNFKNGFSILLQDFFFNFQDFKTGNRTGNPIGNCI